MESILFNTPYPSFNHSRLPKGYTELHWIESTGTQYINAGIKPTSKTRVKGVWAFSQLSNTKWAGFGGAQGEKNKAFECYQYNNNIICAYNNTEKYADITANTWYQFDLNRNVWTIEGLTTFTFTAGTFASPVNLFIFANNRNGTAYYGYGKSKSFEIYEDDVLVFNGIPCINPQNQVGMYDLVSEQFFGNSGTDSFIAGDPVV